MVFLQIKIATWPICCKIILPSLGEEGILTVISEIISMKSGIELSEVNKRKKTALTEQMELKTVITQQTTLIQRVLTNVGKEIVFPIQDLSHEIGKLVYWKYNSIMLK